MPCLKVIIGIRKAGFAKRDSPGPRVPIPQSYGFAVSKALLISCTVDMTFSYCIRIGPSTASRVLRPDGKTTVSPISVSSLIAGCALPSPT